ncbi:MAG TPA: tyrosine-protein phosphatase [Blastocatellia bacterium]|nr:tyrosine-protein phosphatase [Blastocatellia bacterium]
MEKTTPADTALSTVTSPSSFPNIRIKNFGRMDESFYRGAQPHKGDYKALAALGIRTVIDLRDDPTGYEKPEAEAAGMSYVNIPLDDKSKPTEQQIAAFFAVADEQANQPFFVHCAGGRHRTGMIGAIYRFNKYKWDFDQVYREMKNYDFYTQWGHEPIKEYVEEYYTRVKSAKPFLPDDQNKMAVPTSQPATPPPPAKLTE